jgi:hypothetical protein
MVGKLFFCQATLWHNDGHWKWRLGASPEAKCNSFLDKELPVAIGSSHSGHFLRPNEKKYRKLKLIKNDQ